MQRLLRRLLTRARSGTHPLETGETPPARFDGHALGAAAPVEPRRPPSVTADGAIAAAARKMGDLRARVAAAAKNLLFPDGAIAALRRELHIQRSKADQWWRDFHDSNRMLIEALDRSALRVIAAAQPDLAAAASKTPMFTIAMAVWNRAGSVDTAIKSVLAQSFRDWELVIVDDGSTDEIEEVVRPFLADPRISFLRQSNRGEVATRNRILGLARGEVVAYLDSDNFWYPDFLEEAARVFRADPELEIAYGGIAYEWPDGEVRFYLLPFDRAQLERDNLADINVIMHRRSAYARYGGFDNRLDRALEWDLLLRYTTERPAALIPTVGARYRILDSGSVSQNRPLGPNVLHIRRKLWRRPDIAPRILYVAFQFPQLSESHVYAEIACMRRLGAGVEVWAPGPGASPFAHDLVVHRRQLADAIRDVRPDVVHVHWLSVLDANAAALAAAGVPLTVRGHSFDATPEAVARALQLPNMRRLYLLPGSAAGDLPRDERIRFAAPIFDTTLFRPAKEKDPRLVLRASPGLPQNGLRFMLDLARLLPQHRVVVAIARATGHDAEIASLKAYRAETRSPAELRFDVQRPALAALMGTAGIYVHSATPPGGAVQKRIGSTVSIAEAMATGAYLLARNAPAFARYVGDAGATYANAKQAAALIRATEAWTEADWRAAQIRSIERAFKHHADELVLRPMFEDWCAIARENAAPALAAAAD